ncbi:MAG: pyruvate carboxyltransferase [Chloroflexi bacterium]|nr:pyruvate carboxyltransferase [Chloroflexota bacterium]
MAPDSPYQFSLYVPRALEVIDTTLREGAQTSLLYDHHKHFFNQSDKAEIARALIIYGVKFIELFAPVVSPQEAEDFAAIQAVRDELITQKGYTFLLAHARCHPDDVESAIDAGFDGLNLYFGTSIQSRMSSHGQDISGIVQRARSLLEQIRRDYPHLILRFSGEDAFRTAETDLFRVYDEIAPLVHRIGTPDTVGIATPVSVAQRVNSLRSRYPDTDLEGHFHDDRGFALINSLEAIRSGMRYVQTSVLGIGERSGITSMTALLFNLFVDREYDRLDGYNLRGSYPINVLLASKLHKLVQSKEPVSLTNRTHIGGVHQKAVLNDHATYEAHPLDQFGVSESEILLGPLSGWNVIHYFLKEIKYLELDETTAKEITQVFKSRVYGMTPDESPAEILMDIAVNDFKLRQLEITKPYQGAVVQRLDSRPQIG